jgi:hypothetical protein
MSDLINKRDDYLNNTHNLNNYNEILNVNEQLEFNYLSDVDKLNETNNLLKARILKLKQEYILNDAAIIKYNSMTNILYVTIILVSIIGLLIIAFMKGNFSRKVLISLIVLISLAYLIYVLAYILSDLNHKKTAYNQYYWNPVKYEV